MGDRSALLRSCRAKGAVCSPDDGCEGRKAHQRTHRAFSAARPQECRTIPHIRGGSTNRGTGRSSGFRIGLLPPSSPRIRENDSLGSSSPITAAGPRWICTTFPFESPYTGDPYRAISKMSKSDPSVWRDNRRRQEIKKEPCRLPTA